MFRHILREAFGVVGVVLTFATCIVTRIVEAGDNALADVGDPPPKQPAASSPPMERPTVHYRSEKRRAGTLPAPIYPVLHWDDRGDDDDVMEIVLHPTAPTPAPHSANPAAHWEDDVVDAVFKTIAARES